MINDTTWQQGRLNLNIEDTYIMNINNVTMSVELCKLLISTDLCVTFIMYKIQRHWIIGARTTRHI